MPERRGADGVGACRREEGCPAEHGGDPSIIETSRAMPEMPGDRRGGALDLSGRACIRRAPESFGDVERCRQDVDDASRTPPPVHLDQTTDLVVLEAALLLPPRHPPDGAGSEYEDPAGDHTPHARGEENAKGRRDEREPDGDDEGGER